MDAGWLLIPAVVVGLAFLFGAVGSLILSSGRAQRISYAVGTAGFYATLAIGVGCLLWLVVDRGF